MNIFNWIKKSTLQNHEVYQFCGTGVFGYDYYCNGQKTGSASTIISPDSYVNINNNVYRLSSEFISGTTIAPGISRSIVNNDTKEVIAKIIFKDTGKYLLEFKNNQILIEENNGYLFYEKNKLIAKMSRAAGRKSVTSCYGNAEKFFDFTSIKKTPDILILIFLSFPLLKFAF